MRGRRKQHYSGAPQRAGRCRSSAGFGRQRRLVAWWGVGWCVGDAKPTTRTVDVDGRRGGARVWAGASYIGMRAATVVVPLTRRRWQIAVGLRQRRICDVSAGSCRQEGSGVAGVGPLAAAEEAGFVQWRLLEHWSRGGCASPMMSVCTCGRCVGQTPKRTSVALGMVSRRCWSFSKSRPTSYSMRGGSTNAVVGLKVLVGLGEVRRWSPWGCLADVDALGRDWHGVTLMREQLTTRQRAARGSLCERLALVVPLMENVPIGTGLSCRTAFLAHMALATPLLGSPLDSRGRPHIPKERSTSSRDWCRR